jgi:photosystem II stability/assembly factor-like uncharacterized protein
MSLEKRDKPNGYETEQRKTIVAKIIRKPAVRTPEVLDCLEKANDVRFPDKIYNGVTTRRVNEGETFKIINSGPSGTVVGTINPITVNNGNFLICTKVSPYVSIDGSHWFVTDGNQTETELEQVIIDLQNANSTLQSNIDTKIDISEKGAPNGVPPLNENKIIPEEYIDVQSTVSKVKTTTIGNIEASFKNQLEDLSIEGEHGLQDIVMFEDSNIAYVFGNGGELKRSEDKGETWVDVTKPVSYVDYILDSYFFSEYEGVVVGQNGIMRTVDGTQGTEWEIVEPFTDYIWRVDFSGDVGYASHKGNLFFKSIDRGRTWSQISTPYGAYQSRSVCALDEDTVLIGYWDESILKTTDGGSTWRYVKTTLRNYSRDIKFVSPLVGYSCDDNGVIMKTVDGGEIWYTLGIGHSNGLIRIYVVDENEIYFAGQEGIIIKITDGGETCEKYYVGPGTFVVGFYKELAGNLYIMCTGGSLFKSTEEKLTGVNDVLTRSAGWASVKGSYQPTIGTLLNSGGPYKIFFINENVGWCTGDDGGYINGEIVSTTQLIKTIDGGTTWFVNYESEFGNLNGVYFSDELNGWVSGSNGYLYKTTDGGGTWTPIQFDTETVFTSISTQSTNHVFACGTNGVCALSKDGGNTWLPVTGTEGQLGVLRFINEDTGWLGMYAWGTYWKARRTTDGGETWEENWTSGGASSFADISAHNDTILYLIDYNYKVLWTSIDGGDTWNDIYQHSDLSNLYSLKADNTDPNKVWVSGIVIGTGVSNYAVIKYSEDGGLTWTTQYKKPFSGWNAFFLYYMKDGIGVTNYNSYEGLLDNFDNIMLNKGDLILLKNQTNATQNGVYEATKEEPGFLELTRNKLFDETDELTSSTTVSVESGNSYKDCEFMLKTGDEIIVGKTPVVWKESFDPDTSMLFSKVENRVVTPAEETTGEITINIEFTLITVILKNGTALFPTQYTVSGNTVTFPSLLENDTLIIILM